VNFGARPSGARICEKGSWEAFRSCGIARAHYAAFKESTTGPSQFFTLGIEIATIAYISPNLSGGRALL
jgi:hypothetical protein